MTQLTVLDLVNRFGFEIMCGEEWLANKPIVTEFIHRPGLEFAGYLDYFPKKQVQIVGFKEVKYLSSLSESKRSKQINDILAFEPPCLIVSSELTEAEIFLKKCRKHQVPLLRAKDRTSELMSKVNTYLKKILAKEMGVHGVCMNVNGIGLLIRGESGIGKSEIALSLIERKHRLISDDLVILRKIGPEALIGTNNGVNRELLALRGIGLINVTRIFGASAYQDETKISLLISLTPWVEGKYYDSIGMELDYEEFMGIPVKHLTIPIRPGRDIASLIEVACRNQRLLDSGYNAFDEFHQRLKDEK